MPKYRSTVQIVEAEQFHIPPPGTHCWPLPCGVKSNNGTGHFYCTASDGMELPVEDGEWVVLEPGGHGHFTVSDMYFTKRFEANLPYEQYAAEQESILAQRDGLYASVRDAEQVLGAALGYPHYSDDQESFPGATKDDGVCLGDHTLVTLCVEAARELRRLARIEIRQIEVDCGVEPVQLVHI